MKKAVYFLFTLFLLSVLFFKKIIVLLMVIGGYFIAPEASQVMSHYCFGNGDTLVLDSQYLKKSPIIRAEAGKLRINEENKHVYFKQSKDWRLSYAINGFSIKRTRNEYVVKQWIQFDTTQRIHTRLNLGIIQLVVPDDIVHTYDCTPFWVISKFHNLD